MRRLELGKRSRLSRGGHWLAAACLALLAGGAVFSHDKLGALAWAFTAVALGGLLGMLFLRAEDREAQAAEEIAEAAKEAIRSEAVRLDNKRLELEKRLLVYGEWMEFPDFDQLREADWTAVARSEQDEAVARLLAAEADATLTRFSDGTYFEEGRFNARLLLLDLIGFMEKVARVYQPGSDRPLLETNLEALLKAINRASLQIILLLEELPLIEVKELNLRKASEGIRAASKVYKKFEDMQPYLDPVRYLWQGSKLLLTSNPLLAVGWIAGSELLWKGGKHVGKKALNTYFLSLARQTLGIVAWETASIYDRTHRYRNPDWVFAVELTHLASLSELTRETLRYSLKEIGKIPLKSSYDRIFLYRCLAQHVSPRPERFCQSEILSVERREEIRDRLERFHAAYLADMPPRDAARWRQGMVARLGLVPDIGEAEAW